MPARVSDHYRTALVTGASTGLGRAFAEMLLADGVRVWGTSRDPARLAPVAGLLPVALDLRAGSEATDVFHRADRAAGGFDLVINNAGFGIFSEFVGAGFSLWEEQLAVMLVQPARLAHAALPGMLARRRGALVNISSLAVEFPLPFQSAYNMAKAGLSALGESLMIETAGTGVVVLDVRPGDYRTDIAGSVRHPQKDPPARMQRAWAAFEKMMHAAPPPAAAAVALRRALLRRRSGTVRIGPAFQAKFAPFLARFGSQSLRRRVQARYFDAH